MTMTQFNTRIDSVMKERGDAVLKQAGYSPSHAVRALWTFAASHAHEPSAVREFLEKAEDTRDSSQSAIARKLEVLEHSLNLHSQLQSELGFCTDAEITLDDRQLRGEALFSRWEERGLL
ncbi:hypothetical protein [Arabiibacter massiliensis]|uniref:hypothetical protein n=1 Tax=Arabiibacter massiliensis TaxID=1870985 RepID=UPI0009B9A2E1|nr:hypothetical protein [Arabiibacter massiliensis]